jgi:general secretion pathway protein M
MIATASPFLSRAAALGLALIVVAGLAFGLAAMAVGIRDAQVEARALDEELGLLARLAQARGRLEMQKVALLAESGGGARALAGENAAIAGAALQSLVSMVIAGNDGRLDSVLILPIEATEADEAGYTRVGLRASFEAQNEPLRDIIHTLEAGTPSLFVSALTIRGDTAEEKDDPPLSVTIDVYGYLRSASGGP